MYKGELFCEGCYILLVKASSEKEAEEKALVSWRDENPWESKLDERQRVRVIVYEIMFDENGVAHYQ